MVGSPATRGSLHCPLYMDLHGRQLVVCSIAVAIYLRNRFGGGAAEEDVSPVGTAAEGMEVSDGEVGHLLAVCSICGEGMIALSTSDTDVVLHQL